MRHVPHAKHNDLNLLLLITRSTAQSHYVKTATDCRVISLTFPLVCYPVAICQLFLYEYMDWISIWILVSLARQMYFLFLSHACACLYSGQSTLAWCLSISLVLHAKFSSQTQPAPCPLANYWVHSDMSQQDGRHGSIKQNIPHIYLMTP